jgi:hypothetical protein
MLVVGSPGHLDVAAASEAVAVARDRVAEVLPALVRDLGVRRALDLGHELAALALVLRRGEDVGDPGRAVSPLAPGTPRR